MQIPIQTIKQQLNHAEQLRASGEVIQAEALYHGLLCSSQDQPFEEEIIKILVGFYIQSQKLSSACDYLKKLIIISPDNFSYYQNLTNLYMAQGQTNLAHACLSQFIKSHPNHANSYFNLALVCKKLTDYEGALNGYRHALRLGCRDPEEVYLNMANIYSLRHDEISAQELLYKSLSINSNYIPAIFNLAGLHEEKGQKKEALSAYKKILKINPEHVDALVRVGHLEKACKVNGSLIEQLEQLLTIADTGPLEKESLFYCLGKIHDDCQEYKKAFEYYQRGNRLNACRVKVFAPEERNKHSDIIIKNFNQAWWNKALEEDGRFESLTTQHSIDSPIFICGMFRSGSTLAEQILAGHPEIVAGGELDFFPQWVSRQKNHFSYKAIQLDAIEKESVADAYKSMWIKYFPQAKIITDKRPDNFENLGLIKSIFPNAKIILTQRQAFDNILSIYFQQLSDDFNYAVDLNSIATFYEDYLKLKEHWLGLFGKDIYILDYDNLVNDPHRIAADLLAFLDLDWHDACLDFNQRDNLVKTASVWQVRECLYKNSSGRWKNYRNFIDFNALLAASN